MRDNITSVAELESAIEDYLNTHNLDPSPFVWTKTADFIIAETARASAALDAIKNGNRALESEH